MLSTAKHGPTGCETDVKTFIASDNLVKQMHHAVALPEATRRQVDSNMNMEVYCIYLPYLRQMDPGSPGIYLMRSILAANPGLLHSKELSAPACNINDLTPSF